MNSDVYIWTHHVDADTHGGIKATLDVEKISMALGVTPFDTTISNRYLQAILDVLSIVFSLILKPRTSKFILQLPQYGKINRYVGMFINKYFYSIVLLHDVDEIRNVGRRNNNTQSSLLKNADCIITSGKLLDIVELDFSRHKIANLEFWDYLISAEKIMPKRSLQGSVIFAGNLNQSKIPDIYKKAKRPRLCLYGKNYEPDDNQNKEDLYKGTLSPNSPLIEYEVSFGLVWEGEQENKPRYERYNQPHKLSMYLACGIPVIVWKDASYAEKVINENLGITINTLSDISSEISSISTEEYEAMCASAMAIGEKIRAGYFFRKAIEDLNLLD